MSFETSERWATFSPDLFSNLPSLEEAYGSMATDAGDEFKTVLSCYDDTPRTRIRGCSYPENISPTPLTDGRVAVWGLWTAEIVAAWQAGDIAAEELTGEQVEALTVKDL